MFLNHENFINQIPKKKRVYSIKEHILHVICLRSLQKITKTKCMQFKKLLRILRIMRKKKYTRQHEKIKSYSALKLDVCSPKILCPAIKMIFAANTSKRKKLL